MKNNLYAFIRKTLTSRKFWAAVVSSIPFAQVQDWTSFAYVWMAYAGIQGAVDVSASIGKDREAIPLRTHPALVPEKTTATPTDEASDSE